METARPFEIVAALFLTTRRFISEDLTVHNRHLPEHNLTIHDAFRLISLVTAVVHYAILHADDQILMATSEDESQTMAYHYSKKIQNYHT